MKPNSKAKIYIGLKKLEELEKSKRLKKYTPNVLLLGTVPTKTEKIEEKPVELVNEDVIPPEEDIWDVIDQMTKDDIHSEDIDTLSTENSTSQERSETTDTTDRKVCAGCESDVVLIEDLTTGSLVCPNCGMINKQLLDHGPEWRQYNNEDSRGEGMNRCSCQSNPFFPKSSQSTFIVGRGGSRLKRRQKWNCMIYKETSLNKVFATINNKCVESKIPKIIIDTAKILYKRINDCRHRDGKNSGKQVIIRGENRISIMASCVFKSCEMNKSPRSVKEVAKIFDIDEKKVTKGNKQFEMYMKEINDSALIFDQFTTDTAEDYIRRHSPKLRLSKSKINVAVRIAQNCCRMKLASDHNPQSIAAGALLVMVKYFNLNIGKRDISKLFGTSEVTISKINNKLSAYADALVDDEATNYLINKFKING